MIRAPAQHCQEADLGSRPVVRRDFSSLNVRFFVGFHLSEVQVTHAHDLVATGSRAFLCACYSAGGCGSSDSAENFLRCAADACLAPQTERAGQPALIHSNTSDRRQRQSLPMRMGLGARPELTSWS